MKLKLFTRNTELLKTTLSLINQQRKYLTLKFTSDYVSIILINDATTDQEYEIWSKLKMSTIFDEVEIQSLRDDSVAIEINGEQLLQTLKHYEKAHSDGLHIRLQRHGGEDQGNDKSRKASLALYYSAIETNSTTVNHTFKIPIRILKTNHEINSLQEPQLQVIDLIMALPNAFVSTYKRLDKFKRNSVNDSVTIKASRRNGGFLGFVLEEEGKYKVTIRWNDDLDIRKPPPSDSPSFTPDSMRRQNETFATRDNDNDVDEFDDNEDKLITVKLKDWKMASRIVAHCKSVILLLADNEACVMHCLLDDTDDVEIIYSIKAIRTRDD